MTTGHRTGHRGGGRGQMMVVFGLTLTVFIGAMMLGIDLSRLRAEAENAQRAANAAALAGVIFLPDFPANAYYRANEEAHKNGFYDGQNGVGVSATTVSGFNNRLKVTITEPVSLIFGGALGLGPKTVSRSAVAEFDQPLQTGSPDNVLGYAPYPTTMVTPTAPMGFYLENKGPYTYKESGDAYSPLFESFNNKLFDIPSDIPGAASNPCTGDATGNCSFSSNGTATTPNADHFATNPPFSGYNYVINDPLTNTLMIKLFDPYDEVDYNNAATTYDKRRGTAWAPGDSTWSSVSPATDRTEAISGSLSSCYISVGASCSKMIDQTTTGGSGPFGQHQVTLEFSLSGPSISPYDPGSAISTFASYTTTTAMGNCLSGSQNCVYSPSSNGKFDAGDDPTVCTGTSVGSCSQSPYAFRFLNYAVIHGPGYFRLNVQSVANADGTEGTRGNAYGIAVCGVNTAASYNTNTSPNGLGATSDPYTNSPITSAGDSMGWSASSCINPNDPNNGLSTPGACPHPNNPTPADQAAGLDKCIHVYGLGRMAIHNWLGSSTSTTAQDALVPLGMIPPEYAGKTLQIKLYDVGDISGSGDYVNVLTPAGDLTHLPGTTNGTDQYPAGLPYSYSAAPDVTTQSIQTSGTYKTTPAPVSVSDPSVPINVTNSSGAIFNGSWLNIKIPLSVLTSTGKTYKDMVSQFGGYWKMQYHIAAGAAADDATTWEISVVGSPVHLVTE